MSILNSIYIVFFFFAWWLGQHSHNTILRKLKFWPGTIVMLKLLLNVIRVQKKVCDSFGFIHLIALLLKSKFSSHFLMLWMYMPHSFLFSQKWNFGHLKEEPRWVVENIKMVKLACRVRWCLKATSLSFCVFRRYWRRHVHDMKVNNAFLGHSISNKISHQNSWTKEH